MLENIQQMLQDDIAIRAAGQQLLFVQRRPVLSRSIHNLQVKPEPGTAPAQNESLDSDEEELSEAEELRRAAAAYAKVSKRPVQEVIVLDDSSDEEARRAARRRAVPSSSQSHVPVAVNHQRRKPLHQQVSQLSRIIWLKD